MKRMPTQLMNTSGMNILNITIVEASHLLLGALKIAFINTSSQTRAENTSAKVKDVAEIIKVKPLLIKKVNGLALSLP